MNHFEENFETLLFCFLLAKFLFALLFSRFSNFFQLWFYEARMMMKMMGATAGVCSMQI